MSWCTSVSFCDPAACFSFTLVFEFCVFLVFFFMHLSHWVCSYLLPCRSVIAAFHCGIHFTRDFFFGVTPSLCFAALGRFAERFPLQRPCAGFHYLWIPEHSMQSSTPRLMEAQQGAVWPQSQQSSLPGRLCTLCRRLSPPPLAPLSALSPRSLGSLAESMLLVEGDAVRSKRCGDSGGDTGLVRNLGKLGSCRVIC